ncbi:hypothetical protein ACVBEQ_15940 [Nakamurella sp. GG22]
MRTLRAHRRWLTTALLIALGAVLSVIGSPAATAGEQEIVATGPSGSPTPTPTQPMMLASTGLDITVPIIIGLSVLALGTLMVGWAFLATGRRGRHQQQ